MEKKKTFDFKKNIDALIYLIATTTDDAERKHFEEIGLKLKKVEQIAKKRHGGGKLTKEDIKETMSGLCYKNIGYCCGLEKPCVQRDACREALGISIEVFIQVKERMIWEMLKKEDGK